MSKQLQELCRQVRKDTVQSIYLAGSGHPGSSLSAVEIMVTLYFTDVFRCNPAQPQDPLRDRFILSKGHAAPAYYSVLAHKGFFPRESLRTLRKLGSALQGHPNMEKLPCLDMAVGSLGQGLSIANGMAWALKRQQSTSHVFCLIGDGEQQEGQIWEAAMFAAQHKLDNVCLIVDVNGLQLVDAVAGIKNMNAAATQWQSFGWHATCVDGHSIPALYEAFRQAEERRGKPSVILANTVKGKGVSYMENQAEWHGTAPNERQYKSAMRELTREER
ncbi:transketolase [uncultured Megasphaera sp.]|uniref:transketolase n=1 Tax=uncultured Megasphaera sp. TaxID=165188 RepID=UPI0012E199B2|nr:transketolase [uncultured Megasphaera sp.]MUP50149.1 transketolase [Veillonellaceae bacterium M1-70]